MSEISLAKNSAMASPKLAAARVRVLLTELNLHFAGVALLALFNVYLLVHLFFIWRQIQANGPDALHEQELQMRTAEIAAVPLRGLDGKIATATADADQFSSKRLPFADSQVAAELGALAKHEGVRLARTQYSYGPVLAGSSHELTEVRMDVSLSGDYRPLVHVINALERDKMFFLIESMTLTGQQTGTVNLRLRLTTYMRPAMPGEVSKLIAVDGSPATDPVKSVAMPRPQSSPVPGAGQRRPSVPLTPPGRINR